MPDKQSCTLLPISANPRHRFLDNLESEVLKALKFYSPEEYLENENVLIEHLSFLAKNRQLAKPMISELADRLERANWGCRTFLAAKLIARIRSLNIIG